MAGLLTAFVFIWAWQTGERPSYTKIIAVLGMCAVLVAIAVRWLRNSCLSDVRLERLVSGAK